MDDTFTEEEKLYRAVYPPSHPGMFWKRDGSLSPAAFADPKGLSVERGDTRSSEIVLKKMKKTFSGCIVSVTVENCHETDAVVKYLPSNSNKYHCEIHGSPTILLLDKSQRYYLAKKANIEYMEA